MIKTTLLSQGWSEADINQAFSQVGTNQSGFAKFVNKFLGFFTGDLNQSIFKICLRFIVANILLFFILAIPLLFLVPTPPNTGLGAMLIPLITFICLTPLLAIISTVRVFRASKIKSRKLKSLIILLLPIAVPLSFFAFDFLLMRISFLLWFILYKLGLSK